MAIADRLTKLTNDIKASYKVLEEVGVEGNKNTDNLPIQISNVIDKYKSYIPKATSDRVCENALPLNASVEVDGNLEQQTYEGYNLLKLKDFNTSSGGLTLKCENGIITINGTTTTDVTLSIPSNIIENLEELNNNIIGKMASIQNSNITSEKMECFISAQGTWNYLSIVENQKIKSKVFDANITAIRFYTQEGRTFNNKIYKLMICLGNQEKPYEPYVGEIPSPNPQYPQDIEVVNQVKLRQSGKNTFDTKLKTTKITNGVTLTYNNDGTYTVNGTATENTNFYLSDENNIGTNKVELTKLGIEHNNSYKLTGCPLGGYVGWSGYKLYLNVTGLGSNYNDDGNGIVFTPTDLDFSSTYALTIFIAKNVTVNNLTFKPMIRLANVDDDTFEPYHEPKTYEIDLNGNWLGKITNKDLLSVSDKGIVKLEKRVGKVVLNGNLSEQWARHYSKVYNDMCLYNSNAIKNSVDVNVPLISNLFKNSSTFTEHVGEVIAILSNGQIGIALNSSKCPNYTNEEVMKWLKNNNVEVYYGLKTTQTIELPTTEPIKMFEGTNIFELISNLDTDYRITYYKTCDNIINEAIGGEY